MSALVIGVHDPRLPCFFDLRGGHYLDLDEGTQFVAIGRETTDADCKRWAQRFGLNAADLIAFRNAA